MSTPVRLAILCDYDMRIMMYARMYINLAPYA